MRNAVHACLVAAAVLALAGEARAQSAGSLTGTVKDTSGAALPGATVTVDQPHAGGDADRPDRSARGLRVRAAPARDLLRSRSSSPASRRWSGAT